MPVPTIVVDDHRLVAEALSALLARHPLLDVVGSAHDGAAALELLEEAEPGLVVLDVAIPGMDGFSIAREMLRKRPTLAIVMVTGDDRPGQRERALRAGAVSLLTKSEAVSRLLDEVTELHRSGRI